MVALKLRKIGNSVGAVFPQDMLRVLNVSEGDQLFLTSSPDGFRITPYDPEFEKQVDAARRIMKQRRNVLRELAK